jgi:hypothetical protein
MTKAEDLIPRPRLHVGGCGGFLTPAGVRESKRQFSLGQLAKHGAEKRVAPSRLRERARIGQEPWDPGLTARRVVAVDDVAKRVEGNVLGKSLYAASAHLTRT